MPRYEFILKEGDSQIVGREPCAKHGQPLSRQRLFWSIVIEIEIGIVSVIVIVIAIGLGLRI